MGGLRMGARRVAGRRPRVARRIAPQGMRVARSGVLKNAGLLMTLGGILASAAMVGFRAGFLSAFGASVAEEGSAGPSLLWAAVLGVVLTGWLVSVVVLVLGAFGSGRRGFVFATWCTLGFGICIVLAFFLPKSEIVTSDVAALLATSAMFFGLAALASTLSAGLVSLYGEFKGISAFERRLLSLAFTFSGIGFALSRTWEKSVAEVVLVSAVLATGILLLMWQARRASRAGRLIVKERRAFFPGVGLLVGGLIGVATEPAPQGATRLNPLLFSTMMVGVGVFSFLTTIRRWDGALSQLRPVPIRVALPATVVALLGTALLLANAGRSIATHYKNTPAGESIEVGSTLEWLFGVDSYWACVRSSELESGLIRTRYLVVSSGAGKYILWNADIGTLRVPVDSTTILVPAVHSPRCG